MIEVGISEKKSSNHQTVLGQLDSLLEKNKVRVPIHIMHNEFHMDKRQRSKSIRKIIAN